MAEKWVHKCVLSLYLDSLTLEGGCCYHSPCAAKEAEAQRGLDTCPRSHSNRFFDCPIKAEDAEASGPLLAMEGPPVSSVALPPSPGCPVALPGPPRCWKCRTRKPCYHERLAARAPRRPGFSPQCTPSNLGLFSSACPSPGRSGREGSSPGHGPATVPPAPRSQKGPCCSSPGPPPPPSGAGVLCLPSSRSLPHPCSSTIYGSHCLQGESLAPDTALLKLLPHPLGSLLKCRFWVSRPKEP